MGYSYNKDLKGLHVYLFICEAIGSFALHALFYNKDVGGRKLNET